MRSRPLTRFVTVSTLCLVIFGALTVPKLRADDWDKTTKITFSEPVQVPGTTLPAGTYVFKLADNQGDRNIVEIFNSDETQLITTILAIPDYRTQTPDRTIISFEERSAGQPQALRAWFYPGDNNGVEFVYPKQEAMELAQVNQQPVLSTSEEVSDDASVNSANVEPVAPSSVAAVDDSDQPPTQAVLSPAEELPQTASPIPSIALAGIVLLASAFAVRRFSLATR